MGGAPTNEPAALLHGVAADRDDAAARAFEEARAPACEEAAEAEVLVVPLCTGFAAPLTAAAPTGSARRQSFSPGGWEWAEV